MCGRARARVHACVRARLGVCVCVFGGGLFSSAIEILMKRGVSLERVAYSGGWVGVQLRGDAARSRWSWRSGGQSHEMVRNRRPHDEFM